MHGTETPAQPNDPPNFDFPQPDGDFLGEIDQNLDFDAQMASGQWRNMHQVNEMKSAFNLIFIFRLLKYPYLHLHLLQVGESHVDVQRTASSNDQTDSACLKSLPNNYCIGLCCILLLLSTYLPLLHQMTSIESIVSLAKLAKFKSKFNRTYLFRINNDNYNNTNKNKNNNEINLNINQNQNNLSTVLHRPKYRLC